MKESGPQRQVGGYLFTQEIRRVIEEEPDMVLSDLSGRRVAIVFGSRQAEGDPVVSVYCRIQEGEKLVQESSAGGATLPDALRGISVDIKNLVLREIEARQKVPS